jgi:hypothetical protein
MDDKNGFIVQSGINVNKAGIFQTTNGGITWSTKELPVPAVFVSILQCYSFSAILCFQPIGSSDVYSTEHFDLSYAIFSIKSSNA